MDANFTLLLRLLDDCMVELGTSGMVDGDKARNQLLDVRSMVVSLSDEAFIAALAEEPVASE